MAHTEASRVLFGLRQTPGQGSRPSMNLGGKIRRDETRNFLTYVRLSDDVSAPETRARGPLPSFVLSEPGSRLTDPTDLAEGTFLHWPLEEFLMGPKGHRTQESWTWAPA